MQKYVYDIFGPGVNVAARMETIADPMQIVISEDTSTLIRDVFNCSELGEAEVKGFGTPRIYSLDAEASGHFGRSPLRSGVLCGASSNAFPAERANATPRPTDC